MAIAGNRYSVPNVNLSGLEGISKIGDRFRESNKREAFTKRAKEAFESGSMEDVIALNAEFPNLAPAVSKQMIGFSNDRTKQTFSEGFANVARGLEDARMETDDGTVEYNPQMVDEYKVQLQEDIAEVERRGGEPRYMRSVLQNLDEGDMEGAQREAQIGLLYANPDMYDSLYGDVADGAGGGDIKYGAGRTIVKDKNGDQFYATEVRRDGETETVYAPLGQTAGAQPAGEVEIVGGYGETGQERMTRDLRTDKEKRLDKRNQKNAQDASDTREIVMQNAQLYDDAINAVDEGASTTWWTKHFPTLRESTAKLDRVRNQLALNQLSLVSMGALSEKELDVLQQTAIPNMPDDELKGWLKTRRDAERKYADFLQEASIAYDNGESKAQFQKRKTEEAEFNDSQRNRIQQKMSNNEPLTDEEYQNALDEALSK